MFHVKRFSTLLIVSFFGFYLSAMAQGHITLTDKDFVLKHEKRSDILSRLDTLTGYKSLPATEKEAIYWLNLVRMYPKQYNKEVVLPFLEQFPEVKSSYSESLISELNTVLPTSFLIPHTKLNTIAHTHAKDLGSTGHQISHNSSSGATFQKRMNDGGIFSCVSENIYQGKARALQSVLFLLIDNGVPNLGHRKNILNKDMHSIGIAFYPIKGREDTYYAVQNLYCGDPL